MLLLLATAGCGLEQDIASRSAVSGPPQGRAAPPIRGTFLEGGGRFDLGAERGHPVVVDFFASWCGPCHAQQPQLNMVASGYAARGVVVVGVVVRDDPSGAAAYLRANSVPYRAVQDADGSIASAYSVLAPPTTVVIDAAGRVVTSYPGGVSAVELGRVIDGLGAR